MRSKRKIILVLSSLAFAAGATARMADAQCVFQQPRKAKQISLSLVPAFVSCNGSCNFCVAGDPQPVRTPDTSTGIGVPGCSTPQTFQQVYDQQAPLPNGWIWGPKSEGSVSFKTASSKLLDLLNPPNTSDVDIRIKLRDVRYAGSNEPVTADGHLLVIARGTIQSRVNGDMTVIDVPGPGIRVPVRDGNANVKIRANMGLNGLGTSIPGCSALELLGLEILDENGTTYARPGLFLSEIVLPSTPTPTPTPTMTGPTRTPTPTPTSTAPTPTPTPHTRCCEVDSGGCVDLPAPGSNAECQIIYHGSFAQDQTTVCDGQSGTCLPARVDNSFCCQFLSNDPKCIEGPSWDTDCATHYSGGQVLPGERCADNGDCVP